MREYKLILNFLASILIVCFLNSCEVDNCSSVSCEFDGTCVDGTCQCLAGFDGEFCENIIRDRMIGNYTASTTCEDSLSVKNWTITKTSSLALRELQIEGFFKSDWIVKGTFEETSVDNEVFLFNFKIDEQITEGDKTYFVTGKGRLGMGFGNADGDEVHRINYTIIQSEPADTTTCSVEFIAQ